MRNLPPPHSTEMSNWNVVSCIRCITAFVANPQHCRRHRIIRTHTAAAYILFTVATCMVIIMIKSILRFVYWPNDWLTFQWCFYDENKQLAKIKRRINSIDWIGLRSAMGTDPIKPARRRNLQLAVISIISGRKQTVVRRTKANVWKSKRFGYK